MVVREISRALWDNDLLRRDIKFSLDVLTRCEVEHVFHGSKLLHRLDC